ncbi:hypothetical protein [Novosphingobium terrae]|uniref:hypothetical protein n=1 Tax=Novosphingobium terrae TaxID=2726189 RepID=UPI00197E9247|nr:hypothetical protein [Novosphingobium terrae]
MLKLSSALAMAAMLCTGSAAMAKQGVIASLNWPGSAWRFTATQGPDVPDPVMDGDPVPGVIKLCLSKDGGHHCSPALPDLLKISADKDDIYNEPHSLFDSRIVYPREGSPLLLVGVASTRAVNNDARIGFAALTYDKAKDGFTLAYRANTGHNNNQEIRYIESGPLRGAIIWAEPTSNAPFGFWITVSKPGPTGTYVQALRYRSATRYGDGNPLAVIDSEMPNLMGRLGLWHAGQKLPTPAKCANPHLKAQALWC